MSANKRKSLQRDLEIAESIRALEEEEAAEDVKMQQFYTNMDTSMNRESSYNPYLMGTMATESALSEATEDLNSSIYSSTSRVPTMKLTVPRTPQFLTAQ
jgi:hypothetical protein